jgi:tetratricopeptide (TPR) repeat protein
VEAARSAVRTDPKNAGALARVAGLLLRSGDREGAFAAYARAVDAAEDSDQRREWMRALLQIDAERALPAIARAARGGDDETLGVLGRAYLATGRKSEAFDTFLDAHRMDRNDAEWLHHLAALDPGRAGDLFVAEIEASGGSAGDELIGAYARTLLDLGQREKAYGMFLAALEKDEEDWEWMRGLAQADPGQALPLLEARSRREPDDPDTAGALGDAYAALGRTVDAVRQFETAIKASEDPGRWLAALVGVDEGRGMAMLRAALDESPGDDELWGSLGDAYRGLGRHGEAREAYEKALELDPSDWEWNLKRDQLR